MNQQNSPSTLKFTAPEMLTPADMRKVCDALLEIVRITRAFKVDGVATGSTEQEVKEAIITRCQELHHAHHTMANGLCELRGMTEQCNILNHCEVIFCDAISNIVGEHVC